MQAAIENEVKEYIALFSEIKDENGRRMVVLNGFLPERSILTGVGPIPVKQPRVRNKRKEEAFTGAILPRYLRRITSLDNLIPVLYLRYPQVISPEPYLLFWEKMQKDFPQIQLFD